MQLSIGSCSKGSPILKSLTRHGAVQSGRILEQGSHEDLMRVPNGAYALLARARQQEPEPQPPAADDTIEAAAAAAAAAAQKPAAPRKSMAPRKSAAARKSTAARMSVAPGGRAARASVFADADPEAATGMSGGARRAPRSSVVGVQIAGQAFGRMRASVFGGFT